MALQDPLFDPSAGIPTARVGASARSGRRNAQRQRTMRGHPSGSGGPMPGAPEGQLFDTTGYGTGGEPAEPTAPGWGTPHGRPKYPGQDEPEHVTQDPLTNAVPGYRAHPEEFPGGQYGFAKSGIRKYFSGGQFNKPAVAGAVDSITRGLANSEYFRRAGMGAALRHSFGLRQVPSHVNDFLNSTQTSKNRGVNPQAIEADHHLHGWWEY